jgi:nanoRNase/pAp phosphatase (c-di-AMP/oligoRNAs hydrolase)
MIDGKDGKFVSFSVGHSVLNRTSTVDVGSLMLKYGGGGHKAVGTCQIPYEEAEDALHDMSDFIKAQS